MSQHNWSLSPQPILTCRVINPFHSEVGIISVKVGLYVFSGHVVCAEQVQGVIAQRAYRSHDTHIQRQNGS